MILVNTDYISGKRLDTIKIVKGSTIQSKHLGKDITQGLKTLVGGELKAYNYKRQPESEPPADLILSH